MATPNIALLVSTYQKPDHLRRVLESIALQEGVDGRFEVVATDDGSTDETRRVVEQFARDVSFPVRMTTHKHQAFQLARCRNEGVAASTAPYVLFLDGDCVLPRDHVYQHLRHRKPRTVMGGYCCRLDCETSDRITIEAIRSGEYLDWIPKSELRSLAKLDRKSRFYNFIRHRGKPKIFGGNIAIWRTDYEEVNGFDENFVGWGGEDDDLRLRVRAAGMRIESILRWTRTYHLWHPSEPSAPKTCREGVNIEYLTRKNRPTRCENGYAQCSLEDVHDWGVPGDAGKRAA